MFATRGRASMARLLPRLAGIFFDGLLGVFLVMCVTP